MKHRVGVVIVAVGVLGTAGVVAYRSWRAAPPSSAAVAVVDGKVVYARELDIRLAQILPMASYHGNIERSRLIGLRRAALDDLILDELIYREAVTNGASADSSAVEEELTAARKRFETSAEYESALEQNGMTESEFRRDTARTLVIRQARQARADQQVTDAEAESYYLANARKFLRPEQVHLLELLVRVDPANPESAGPAERKARRLANRIRAGEAFGPLAREYSQDDYRVKDGDLGLVHRGRLDADLEAAAFAARTGQVYVTRTIYGYHVFEVVERQAATQLTFAEARPIVLDRMTRERREQAERTWHRALRNAANISILDPTLRDAVPAELPQFRPANTNRTAPNGADNTTR